MVRYIAGVICSMLLMNSCFADTPAKVFQSVLPQVKAETAIPILLPSEFPAPIVEEKIHDIEGKGTNTSYEFNLYYEKDYGNAGYFGSFTGELGGNRHFKGKQVTLENGITGYFWGKSCGGSCSPSHFAWLQDKVLYSIELKIAVNNKLDEEKVMILIANSAIRGGSR